MTKWQAIGGLGRQQFPLVPPHWVGPSEGQAILTDDDNVKAIRGRFGLPDGTERWAEVRYLARGTKQSFYRADQ